MLAYKKKRILNKSAISLFLLSLPSLLLVLLFRYVPLFGIIIPFKNFNAAKGIFGSEWSGFNNFKYLFSTNMVLNATKNTIIMNVIFIVVGTCISLLFSLIMNEMSRKSIKFYQTVFLFPYFVSWVVAGYIFLSLFDMDYGFVNSIIEMMGGQPIVWYNEARYWPYILLFANIWKGCGYSIIIYYTSIIGIDKGYYEAAAMDGASKIKQISYITLPHLVPIVTIMLILSIGKIFHADFGLFYFIPMNSPMTYPTTDVIDTFVYRVLIQIGDFGMSSAATLYQSIVGFILVIVSNSIIRKMSPDNALF